QGTVTSVWKESGRGALSPISALWPTTTACERASGTRHTALVERITGGLRTGSHVGRGLDGVRAPIMTGHETRNQTFCKRSVYRLITERRMHSATIPVISTTAARARNGARQMAWREAGGRIGSTADTRAWRSRNGGTRPPSSGARRIDWQHVPH